MSRFAIAFLLASLAFACARTPSWPPSAVAFRGGEEACAECRMLVSDARFAVQVHSREGVIEWFDDLGCLLAERDRSIEPQSVFVHDFDADAWVRGDHGHAVHVPGLDSPMGYGWAVHASAGEGAERVALADLLTRE